MDVGGRGMRPLVSVIVPTHNRAHCLPRALASIAAQEGRGESFDIEVLVVDDGSSDGTAQVMADHGAVRYIRLPEQRGVSAARNAGLRASQGGYLGFLDSDDEWLPHKLRVQVPLLAAHPEVGVIYSQVVMRSPEGERLSPDEFRALSGQTFVAMLMDNVCEVASLL